MTVICQKSLTFTEYEVDSTYGFVVRTQVPIAPGITAGIGTTHVLNGPLTLPQSPKMQIAPNWIRNTLTFTTAVATGDLVVMSDQNLIGGNSYPST